MTKTFVFCYFFLCDSSLFFVQNKWRQFKQKNHHHVLMLSFLIQIFFLLHDNAIIFTFGFFIHEKNNLFFMFVFYFFMFCFETLDIFSKIISSHLFFWWMVYSFSIMFIHKRFNFWNSFRVFPIFMWFNAIVAAYWNMYCNFYW